MTKEKKSKMVRSICNFFINMGLNTLSNDSFYRKTLYNHFSILLLHKMGNDQILQAMANGELLKFSFGRDVLL